MDKNKLIEALETALAELKQPTVTFASPNSTLNGTTSMRLAEEIEELLAQPEQEHVGIVRTIGGYPDESDHIAEWTCSFKYLKDGDRLYLAPPKREPLSDESIDLYCKNKNINALEKLRFQHGVIFAEREHGIGVDDE